MAHVYTYEIEVAASAIDANGHANNVEFVRWMQDAAVSHADERGCTAATRAAGAAWVVHSHRIEYRRPAFAGDRIRVRTWVADFRRAFSLRKYEMVRAGDGSTAGKWGDGLGVHRRQNRPAQIDPGGDEGDVRGVRTAPGIVTSDRPQAASPPPWARPGERRARRTSWTR